MTEDQILGTTFGRAADAGSNLRGSATGGAWLYALPRLSFDQVVCLGTPPDGTLLALARAGREVLLVPTRPRRRPLPANVRAVRAAAVSAAAPDLLVVSRAGGRRWKALLATLTTAGSGLVYREGAGPGRHLRITPAAGDARTAAPAEDLAAQAQLRHLGLEGTLSSRGPLARLERAVTRRVPVGSRTAALGGAGPDAPAYLRAAAAAAGVDLTGYGWAVSARGEYDSQKVLVLLQPPGAPTFTHLVKVPRGPAHNGRLANEGRALRALTQLPEAAGRCPAPWFEGSAGGRTLVGEGLLPGRPYGAVATWEPGDPLLRDAAEWLTALGRATARPVAARDVAAVLADLLDRWTAAFAPPEQVQAALHDAFERLGRCPDPIPLVAQHGDPGTWNLLADAAGRTLFLDWESYEPNGLPLWDLLYFTRSYAQNAGYRSGERDPVLAATRHLVDGSPLGDALVASVTSYCTALDLPSGTVEPLVLGCWLHRSLKESARMAAPSWPAGDSAHLLARLLEDTRTGPWGRLRQV